MTVHSDCHVLLWAVHYADVRVGICRSDLGSGVHSRGENKLHVTLATWEQEQKWPLDTWCAERPAAEKQSSALHKITSPNSTLLSETCSVPLLISMVLGTSEACCAGSATFHNPPAVAVALCDTPSNATFTLAPELAQPQIGAGRPRCSTMFEPSVFETRSSAELEPSSAISSNAIVD